MEKLLRKTGINQSLRLLLIVASFVFGSSAWGQTTTTIFSETFDNFGFDGGNDGNFSKASGTALNGSDTGFDNSGWTTNYVYGANKCVKIGGGSKQGFITTPSLNFTGSATLKFRAGAWKNAKEKTQIYVSITNGK